MDESGEQEKSREGRGGGDVGTQAGALRDREGGRDCWCMGPWEQAPAQSRQRTNPGCWAGRGEAIRAANERGAVESLFFLGVTRGIEFGFISSLLS